MHRYFSYNQSEMQFIILYDLGNQSRALFLKQKSLNTLISDQGNQRIHLLRYSNQCNLSYLTNLTEVGQISKIRENQVGHTQKK